MKLLAPAKINLHLRVFGVQNDGFHPLLSWMTTVGLFDTLEIEPIAAGISLTCDDPTIPCDGKNLAVKAAALMLSIERASRDQASNTLSGSGLKSSAISDSAASSRRAVEDSQISDANVSLSGDLAGMAVSNSAVRGLRVHLSKRIPAGGGLGGGSSDAAAMLMGLNRLLARNMSLEQLLPLAAALGSDVPFFLFGPSSICTGRGEIVQPIAPPKPRWAVLALPEISMPTPRVYQVFDSLELGKAQAGHDEGGVDQPSWQEWTSLNADELLPRLINDLEAPAFKIAPELGRLRSELEQALGKIVRMSGSGSTLFTLFESELETRQSAELIQRRGTRAIAVELGAIAKQNVEC